MGDTVTPKWKEKYLETLKKLVEAQAEIELKQQTIVTLTALCNEQQDELRALKYKHP